MSASKEKGRWSTTYQSVRSNLIEALALDDYERRFNYLTIGFFTPTFVLLFIVGFLPLVLVFQYSLYEANLAFNTRFVGLDNYVTLLMDPAFRMSLWRGILFATGTTALTIVFGLTVSMALNSSFKSNSYVKWVANAGAIFPYLVPAIVVVFMWKWLMDPTGPVIFHLSEWGLVDTNLNVYNERSLAMIAVIFSYGWKITAFSIILFLARLRTIEPTLYEQARINGAGAVRMFRDITLPHLKSTILLIVLLRGTWMFTNFSAIWLFTKGGPVGSTTTLPIYMYRLAFFEERYGLANASGVIFFLILVAIATIYFVVFNPSEEIEPTR